MGVHETSMNEHLTNFTVVRHGNKQNKINLKMQKLTTTKQNKNKKAIKSHAFKNKPETTETTINKKK